jgi:hypothetical protein
MGSIIEGSSFSGLLTRVDIGHIRIKAAQSRWMQSGIGYPQDRESIEKSQMPIMCAPVKYRLIDCCECEVQVASHISGLPECAWLLGTYFNTSLKY